jgi:peptidyl-prolyl cis-trans isomerase D
MMTKLREMTFIFIWILVIAFVGLMVFEWGMDFTGLRGRSNIVGKIDGNKITIQDFQRAIQSAYLEEKQNTGSEPDENRMSQLRDQVWEMYIQRILFAKEITKRDIKVTDREILLQIQENPPADIQQNPNFLTDGKFDMQKYREALQNPEINWLPVENYYREFLPFQKLQNIVLSSLVVTEEELRNDFRERNQKAKIEYLYVPVSAFTGDSISITDEEIKEYYQIHKEDFKVEEKRKLNYVLFSTVPTAEDSAKIYRLAEDIKAEAMNGEDFAKLADEYSEDPSVTTNHGDLGFFERERMVKEFSDAAFAANMGEITGPVKTQFGLHIIKIHEKRNEKGVEQIRASHILLKFTASPLTIEDAQITGRDFSELASEENFTIAAEQKNQKIEQTAEFEKSGFIPGFGSIPSASDWAFKAKTGEVSKIYRTTNGYVVFELAQINPENYRPFEEVKENCQRLVEQEKRKEIARSFAVKIQEKLNQNLTFTQISKEISDNKVMYDSTGDFTISQSIPKIGMYPTVSAAAFSLPLNKTSSQIETERGFYFIRVLNRTELDEEVFKSQRESIRLRLMNQKRQQFYTQWYENLKEKSDIEDDRDLFFSS